jgi:hypothetical protein
MKGRPIIFTDHSVEGILAGRKTQTRRVIKPQPSDEWHPEVCQYAPTRVNRQGEEYPGEEVFGAADEDEGRVSSYGRPGDRLWVREAWRTFEDSTMLDGVLFRTDKEFVPIENCPRAADLWVVAHNNGIHGTKWRSPMFMPRWASRIKLEVTEIRVQRVQDISEEDARAEGVQPSSMTEEDIADMQISDYSPQLKKLSQLLGPGSFSHKFTYQTLWDEINSKRGKGEFAWKKNPWVWAITFRRLESYS